MATWDDVRRLVAALPDTDEHASYGGCPSWRVHGKAFVWDRPLRSADRRALAEAAPDETEPLLGIRVADEGVKAALIAGAPDVFPGVMAWQPLTAADLPLLAGWLREPQVARWNHEHTAEAVAGAAHSPRPRDSTQRPCDPRVGAGL